VGCWAADEEPKASSARAQPQAALIVADEFGQIMKHKLSALSGRYLAALQKHVRQSSRASLSPARGLGRQAAAIGLETLDVAKIHERALAALEASRSKDGIIGRAGIFFTETISPIEETHRAALKASTRLNRLNQKLDRCTVALAASNRSLQQGIARRKTVESALKKSGEHYKTLLEDSQALQKHLQHLAHRILWGQEHKRKKISHDLQDEIAQTLLGINVRLLTVKRAAGRNVKSLQKEIANTQRLVDMSVRTIERFAREYGKHHEP
jgi:signal transduction histidine kinase